jgi:hypothetical protein
MRFTRASIPALALCALPGAHAAHPLITEDANTIGPGQHQIEVNTDWLRDLAVPSHLGALTLTYGAYEGLDIFVNVPAGVSSPRGIGDASLGAKWVYHEAGNTRLVLKPELLLPTGSESRSLGTGRAGLALNFVSTTTNDRWQWHCNLAFEFYRYGLESDRATNRNTLWRISGAAQYALTDKLQLAGDMGITRPRDTENQHHPVYLLAGAIYSPNPDLDLDAGIRFFRYCGPCAEAGNRQFGVGLTWRF